MALFRLRGHEARLRRSLETATGLDSGIYQEETVKESGISRGNNKRHETSDVGLLVETTRELRRKLRRQKRTIEALRASNFRFRLGYERSPDGIILTAGEAVLFANPQACRILGMTEDEIRTAGTRGIIEEDLEPTVGNTNERMDGESLHGEAWLRRKDGRLLPVEMSVAFFMDADRTLKTVRLFRDISERKRVESALAEQMKGLRFLSSSATRLLDPMPRDEFFAYVGERLQSVTGKGVSVVTEYRVRDNRTVVRAVVGPEDRIRKLTGIMGGSPVGLELTVPDDLRERLKAGAFVRVEGGLYELAFRQLPIPLCERIEQLLDIGDIFVMPFVLGNDFLGTVAVAMDRAEGLKDLRIVEAFVNQAALALKRKRVEDELQESHDELEKRIQERTAELQESNARYRDLSELLPEMVFEADLTGRFTYANRQALETFGYTFEEFGRGIRNVDVVAPHERARLLENGARILHGERRTGAEYVGRKKDGTEFPIMIRAVPIEKNGAPVGFRGVVVDLTDSKKAEEERRTLEEQLHQAMKMEAIGTLAGGIAHDFNNMLAVILGNAELALDDVSGTDAARNIEQIVKASKRARDLVREILTFSRKTERQRKPLRLTPLVEETFRLLRGSLPSTIDTRLDVRVTWDVVIADPSQIRQVLMNLATNAAHAIGDNRGTLSITLTDATFRSRPRAAPDLQPGEYVRVSVADTGSGMTRQVQKRIFEPFFTTKEPHAGTGMGLAVVYGIVRNHEGAITVESKPGKGSTFDVFLPKANTVAEEEPLETGYIEGGRGRILLVDDEPSVVKMASGILERLGYTVMTAENGTKAWDVFERAPSELDLVITDQTMPDITGIELARKMMETRKDIPVILFTGYSRSVSAETARAAGIDEFLMKPVERKTLAETVRRVLSGKTKTSARP
jgi:PAS domain S-box-containing protein